MKRKNVALKTQHSDTSEKETNQTPISKKQMSDLLSKLNDRDKIEISGTARISTPISGTTTSNSAKTNDDHPLPRKTYQYRRDEPSYQTQP